jgi:hypothetical protein
MGTKHNEIVRELEITDTKTMKSTFKKLQHLKRMRENQTPNYNHKMKGRRCQEHMTKRWKKQS